MVFEYKLEAFITNLGKYNEGELLGKYISFPISKAELKLALDEIGINEEYEEYFFTDFDGTYPASINCFLSEYMSIEELNKIALALQKVCDECVAEEFEAFLEHSNNFYAYGFFSHFFEFI